MVERSADGADVNCSGLKKLASGPPALRKIIAASATDLNFAGALARRIVDAAMGLKTAGERVVAGDAAGVRA